jgi:hypothetical protein
VAARRRPIARAAALPARRATPALADLRPTGRSVLVAGALLVLAVAAYVGARETSVFAVQAIDVRGGTPLLREQVRDALAIERGASLVTVNGSTVAHRVAAIPGVRSFAFDRAFPHTLRVVVRPEVPVLVVRRVPGADAFLVAASGKVIRLLPHARRSSLPRVWVKKATPITVGAPLPGALAGATASLAALRGSGLPGGVRTVRAGEGTLTLTLGGGLELRLGDSGDLRLKLAIARRILAQTGAATAGGGYLDVSLPERPVLSTQSQVGG